MVFYILSYMPFFNQYKRVFKQLLNTVQTDEHAIYVLNALIAAAVSVGEYSSLFTTFQPASSNIWSILTLAFSSGVIGNSLFNCSLVEYNPHML